MDFGRFTHLTFDCYGTLIDWESGILGALAPVLERHGVPVGEARLLRLYARHEAEQESGPYRRYRDVLRGVAEGIARELGFEPTAADLDALSDSVGRWPPFPDSAAALARLQTRYRLVILSNVDDAMFADSARLLGVDFDGVITAQQVGSYKPALKNFRVALERLGVARERVLHVAQSLFHDHVPAKALGLSTVWVRRASRLGDTGVAPPAAVEPDLVVGDLESLAAAMGL